LLILVAVEQLESILEDSDKRINALLTAEQQKAYADVEQEMRAQLKARRGLGAATTWPRSRERAHDRPLPVHPRVILIKHSLDFRIHRQFQWLCWISNLVAEPYRFAMPLDPFNDCSLGRTRYSDDWRRGARDGANKSGSPPASRRLFRLRGCHHGCRSYSSALTACGNSNTESATGA
jgi:hypothetical protein